MIDTLTFAFQPIVDLTTHTVFSHEALIRGVGGAGAHEALATLQQVPIEEMAPLYAKLFALATRVHIASGLNFNLTPQQLSTSEVVAAAVVAAAEAHQIAPEQLIAEVTESQSVADAVRFSRSVNILRAHGLRIAIDDFGAGYSGLNLLVDFQPDLLKLDMHLVRGIDRHGPRQAIVRGIAVACEDLGIDVIAEGVEAVEELRFLQSVGIHLYQGYLFARPSVELLPEPVFPA